MALTPKQARFVDEYLVDLNATQAAIRAGYSEKTAGATGHENLNKPEIAAAIEAARANRTERTKVDQDYVLANLTEVVERCMQRAPVMVRDGKEMVQLVDDEGRHVWQFNSSGANKSLELLARHLGMLNDKATVTHEGETILKVVTGIERAPNE